MTPDDVQKLREDCKIATAALSRVTVDGYYPDYPSEIEGFMESLSESPWYVADYSPDVAMAVESNLKTADLKDIFTLLTYYCRSERFSDGAWLRILKEDKIAPIISRLECLLESS
ncbi:MAG: hypothetical protein D6B27_07360 [Gammaproteobacteria bacterium]|nr:MAG: hypothetical protein D6B27_07360 [Gammaproteobacteria bacterium]